MPLYDTRVSPSVSPSIASHLNRVMRQVEYHCFANLRTGYIDPLYKELCLIISEVFVINPEGVIKVNGSEVPIRLIQEVYEQLRNDHIQLVFANFQSVSCKVYNKKAYLRTALYNAVFELESHSVNDGYLF